MGPVDWSKFGDCVVDANQPANIQCVEALFSNLVATLVSLAGIALFVMLIIGGFTYLTAGSDPEKAGKARSTMTWAIIGIAMMILSYIILRAIYWFTGVNVLDFNVLYFSP